MKKIFDINDYYPSPILLIDNKNQIISTNKKFSQVFNLELGSISTLDEFFKKVFMNEENRKKYSKIWYTCLYDCKYGKTFSNSFEFNITDDAMKNMLVRFSCVEEGIYFLLFEDQTERRKIESTLRATEEKYKLIFENSPFGILHLDSNGIITDCNKEFLKIFQAEEKDYMGLNILDVTKDKKMREVVIESLNGSKSTFRGEYKSVVSKKKFFMKAEFISFKDDFNNTLGSVGIFEDISKLKKDDDQIQMLAQSLKSINECVIISDLNHKIIYTNSAFNNLYGYESEELLGKNISVFHYGKEDKKIQEFIDRDSLATGWKGEIKNKRKDGKKLMINLSTNPIKDENGKTFALLGVVEDITQKLLDEEKLKDSEERYRILFDLSPSGILLEDSKGNILAANPSCCKSLGYEKDELIGKNVIILAGSKRKQDVIDNLNALMRGEELFQTVKSRKKDGTFCYMELNEKRVQLPSGEYGILSVANDITDRIRYEEELIHAKDKAEESDKLKSEFLAQISHEIRTPINTMLSFSSLIKEELDPIINPELKESFAIISNAGQRIIRTVDLLLNMSELQSGVYKKIIKKFDLYKDVIQAVAFEHEKDIKEKNLELILLKKTTDSLIEADHYTIYQIFDNLLNNAIKFTISGKIELVVLRNSENKLAAQIIDTGIGISKNYLNNLFVPFSQEEQGYTRKFEGNGLGLALVKKYCELNNAEITVDSQKGIGTKFEVIFN